MRQRSVLADLKNSSFEEIEVLFGREMLRF